MGRLLADDDASVFEQIAYQSALGAISADPGDAILGHALPPDGSAAGPTLRKAFENALGDITSDFVVNTAFGAGLGVLDGVLIEEIVDSIDIDGFEDAAALSATSTSTPISLSGVTVTGGCSALSTTALSGPGVYTLGAATAVFIGAKLIDMTTDDGDDWIPSSTARTDYDIDITLEYAEGALSIGEVVVEDGGAGRDFLYGGSGDDIPDAGASLSRSFRYLYGEGGDETYRYGVDNGDVYTTSEQGHNGAMDRIVFKDLSLSDLTFSSYDSGGASEGDVLQMSWAQDGETGSLRIGDPGQDIEEFSSRTMWS